MEAKYVNGLVQKGYWSYDLVILDNNEIVFRVNTMFNTRPTSQDFIDRVNLYLLNYELNYTIDNIEEPWHY